MSLRSATADPRAAKTRPSWLGPPATLVLALAVGVVVGLSIPMDNSANSPERVAVAPGGLTHEDFLRLNTTELRPMSSQATSTVDASPEVDQFYYWNVTALDELAAAMAARGMSAEPFGVSGPR